ERPDIIHSHLTVLEYLFLLNVKKLNIKLYYTIHSEVDRVFGKGNLISKICAKYYIKYKNMIPIALHSGMQKEVNNLFYTNKCIVLNNAIDMKLFNPRKYDKQSIKKTLNLQKDVFVIGHIGRFVELKNHSFLIKVFKAVIEQQTNAHLLLIGIGELEEKIRKQVRELGLENRVSFLGNR